MSNIEVDTIEGPAHWASYLVNGDDSGMEPEDKAECDAWVENLYRKDGWYVVSCEGEAFFGRFDGMGCDLIEYTLHRKADKAPAPTVQVKSSGRQAITTKYHGPTNTRGSRISATTGSGIRIYISYDYALDTDKLHEAACKALVEHMGWGGDWIGGQVKSGDWVWVTVR